MTESLETLFEVDGRSIVKNSIQVIQMGPGLYRMMVIGYDPALDESTWIMPGASIPGVPKIDRITMDTSLLIDRIAESGKHYLCIGGTTELKLSRMNASSLEPEQRRIYENWDEEIERAGYGGISI